MAGKLTNNNCEYGDTIICFNNCSILKYLWSYFLNILSSE